MIDMRKHEEVLMKQPMVHWYLEEWSRAERQSGRAFTWLPAWVKHRILRGRFKKHMLGSAEFLLHHLDWGEGRET